MTFAKGMKEIILKELVRMNNEFFKREQQLPHTPYANFRGAKKHQVRRLKVWPKLKSLRVDLKSWGQLKWRPLNSYHKHYWRNLLGLLSRW